MRALRYAFDEAVVSLWRGRQSGILSTATIAVALFVLGGVPHRHVEPRAARRRVEPGGRDVGLSGRRCVGREPAGGRGASRRRAPSSRAISSSRRTRRCAGSRQTFADLASVVDTRRRQPAAGVLRSPARGRRRERRRRSTSSPRSCEETPGVVGRALRPPVARSPAVGGDVDSERRLRCSAAS